MPNKSVETAYAAAAPARWRLVLPIVAAAALAAVVPILVLGSPDGHDFSYHLGAWRECVQQWHSGIWLAHWSERANWGFGEPRFIFYPPLSRILGGLMLCLLPANAAPGAYFFLVLLIAGLSMFTLVRHWLPPSHAVLAAAFYAVNPYLLLCVYQRTSMAEMLTVALSPLLLWAIGRLPEGNKAIPPLALVFGLFWISDLPAAVIATYAAALGILVLAIVKRSFAVLARGVAGMLLGFALMAFFVLPAAYEQRWVHISQAITEDFRPENWEYTWTFDPEAEWFYAMISGLVYVGSCLAGLAAILAWWERRRCRAVYWVALAWTAAAIPMMFPTGRFAWAHLPKMVFIQFPWRWLLILSASLTACLVLSMARFRARWLGLALLTIALAGGIAVGWTTHWHPGAVTDLEKTIENDGGHEGGPEFMPPEANFDGFHQARLQPPAMASDPRATVSVLSWAPERKVILTQSPQPTTLTLRLLRYPAWKATVNGKGVGTVSDALGRVVVPVPAGEARVQVGFARTPDRLAGISISLLTLVVLGVLQLM